VSAVVPLSTVAQVLLSQVLFEDDELLEEEPPPPQE
jgi:hypothetical protein